jgi:uncharacterized protein YidB (DUF937 family)
MGLLDAALGMLGGNQGQGGDTKSMLIQAVIGMLGNSQNGQQGGGLQSLIGSFQNAGLGEIVGSWVGTGQNMPISAAQIQQALGGGHLSQLADAAGVSHDEAAGGLAEMLPGLIDKLTPDGQVPSTDNFNPADLMQQFSSLFGST